MNNNNLDFSDIAPYNDMKVRAVLSEIHDDEAFLEVMTYAFPGKSKEEISKLTLSINSVDDFQAKISYTSIKNITNNTSDKVELRGVSNIDSDRKHLYISNHRDIVLDSALFNVLLFENNVQTTETAIGDNLLGHPTVHHLTKINKNFTVKRGLKGRELYFASVKLSKYIRKAITDNITSIWISQREGRAKDGDDKTQKGLLKMLGLSGSKNLLKDFEELNIRTLSISYEYDPCDVYKLRELLAKEKGEEYEKSYQEDKISIVTGIMGDKGNICFSIGKKLDNVYTEARKLNSEAEQLDYIMKELDMQIYSNYCLWPNNYIALDMLKETSTHKDKYSKEDISKFEKHIENTLSQFDDPSLAKRILLKKYANPTLNYLSTI